MGTARARPRWRQMAIVALIAFLVGGYLLFVRDGTLRLWFRGVGFWADLVLNSAIVLTLFLAGRAIGQVVVRQDPRRFLLSFTDAHLVYAIPFFVVVAITVQFILQMNRMIGANVLGYFAAGVYRQPKAEERIFLFLDLEGSTQLAERLRSARYFELLRRFVDDLTEPILEAEGEIYQYAGDEVVITWPIDKGVRAANCVRCSFGIRAAVERSAGRYDRTFGAATTPCGDLEIRGKEACVTAFSVTKGAPASHPSRRTRDTG